MFIYNNSVISKEKIEKFIKEERLYENGIKIPKIIFFLIFFFKIYMIFQIIYMISLKII